MVKKSFKENNPAEQYIFSQQEKSDEQSTKTSAKISSANILKDENEAKKKLPRLNKVFSEKNYDYLETISHIKGISISKYLNELVTADRANHADDMAKIKVKKKKKDK